MNTCADSGSLSTHHYGEKIDIDIDIDKIPRDLNFTINFYPPMELHNDENITFYIERNFKLLDEIDVCMDSDGYNVNNSWNTSYPWNSSHNGLWFTLGRKITEDEIGKLDIGMMPGFKLRWFYGGTFKSEYQFKSTHFKR